MRRGFGYIIPDFRFNAFVLSNGALCFFVDPIAGCSSDVKEPIASVAHRVLKHLRQEEETLFPWIRKSDRTGSMSGKARAELDRRLKAKRHEHGVMEEAFADLEDLETERESALSERMKACFSELTDVSGRQPAGFCG